MGVLYCIPRILRDYPGKYKIIVGWHGREYLYRHLADEFWEINPENMWLKEYSRAFHFESKNLEKLEKSLENYGTVVPSAYLGKIAISIKCMDCRAFLNAVWSEGRHDENSCMHCKSKNVIPAILGDVSYWKPRAIRIPAPSEEKVNKVKSFMPENAVGVFARGRKCYGRNLQSEFYVKLIDLLREKNYEPIWIGEKSSILPCPVKNVLDFSEMKESRDLETTFSVIKNCKFTVQFWTASSRLAGLMGVPYLLFESPDQIWGKGQEGIRRNLCDFGPRKLSVNHYLNVYNNNDRGLEVVKKCIEEMEVGNYEDSIGLVDSIEAVENMRKDNLKRIGENIC